MAKLGFKALVGSTRSTKSEVAPSSGFRKDPRAAFREISEKVQRIVKGLEEITPEAMVYGLQEIFAQSQREVPVLEGDLKGSGYLEVVVRSKNPVVEIGYARNGKPNYAVFVHENRQSRHEAPTKAKFLEDPLNKGLNTILPRIQLALSDGIVGKETHAGPSRTPAARRKARLKRIKTRKKKKSRFGWGGKRKGAGRPKGSTSTNSNKSLVTKKGGTQDRAAKVAALKKSNADLIARLLRKKKD